MNVICICGKAGAGKDTVAKFMKDRMLEFGRSVIIVHYADLLKYVCKKFLEWNGQKDVPGRTLLQETGQKFREMNPNYWVQFVQDVLTLFSDKWDYVLIPDTRFDNECEIYVGNDPLIINVIREDYESKLTEEQKSDVSEQGLVNHKPHVTIYNNASLSDLERKISVIAGYVMGAIDYAECKSIG